MSAPITLDYALTIARQLSPPDRARLIARLADDLVSLAPATTADDLAALIPIIAEGQWDTTIPGSRAELYDDDERC